MEEFFQVGIFTNTHGVRGEIKVFPTTDDISRFKKLKEVILRTKEGDITMKIAGTRMQKQMVLMRFAGIDNINDIEKYKGQGLYVTKENRVELKDDEYFIADLIGCEVYVDTDSDKKFGTISDVMETGANDVYEITLENGKTVLVPAIKECILNVDIEGGRVDIHLLEGLMD